MQYKHNYDKALYRYTQIIAKLYSGDKLSNKDLADEFGVSTKTIQRDFAKLVLLFPIFQDKKLWQLKKGFEFREDFSIEDEITLKLLESTSKSFDESFAKSAEKLLKRIDENIFSPIYTKIDIEDISPKLHEIKTIESAINENRKISFLYQKDENNFKTEVEPYKIVNFEGFWYLVSKRDGALRRYYLKNISDVTTLDEKFKKSKQLQTNLDNALNIWFEETKPYEVELLVSSHIAKYFQRKPISKTQNIKGFDSDGHMQLTLDITDDNELIPLIKYWLPHIKVVSPNELNEKIKKDVEKFLKWT
ncbi:MAG: WYL domain-containing transcriptional regulator [Erysipelotrichia bacterium]|nr:WYL domain-containing transcriptional regulator [Erysipelotrichia bacterium]